MFSQSAEKAGKSASGMEKNIDGLKEAFDNINTLTMIQEFQMLSTVFKSLIAPITDFTSSIVDMASHFEQTQKGLETVLQSAEKGQQMFEDLRKFSFETTFGVDELASASHQLLNAGTSAGNLQKQLKMLGDVAQGDKNKFAELTSIFSKIELQGKASAMALSQFNIRGVPLAKTLKEMGVTGTASFEQVREALEKLTDEGGQFHNAMDNIIDTIEGKRGFIDDTMKEILVNFGEASGLTDAYKAGLDLLYSVLEKVNNALMAINENPFLKALVTGLFASAITSIVIAIGSSLIPKLTAVIAKLVTINALKGPLGWLTLGIGGAVAGFSLLGSAMDSYDDSTEEAIEKTNALTDSLENLHKMTRKEWAENQISFQNAEIKALENNVKELQKQKAELLKKGNIARTEKDDIFNSADFTNAIAEYAIANSIDIYAHTQEELAEMYIANLEKEVKSTESSTNKKLESLDKEIEKRKELLKYAQQMKSAIEIKDSILSDDSETQLNSVVKQIETLKNTLNSEEYAEQIVAGKQKFIFRGYFKDLYPELAKEFEKSIELLNKEKKEIEVKIKLANLKDWQKVIQKAFNLSDKDVLDLGGTGMTGAVAVDKFVKDTNDKLAHMITFADALGLDKMDIIKSTISDVEKALKELADSGLWESNEETIVELKDLLHRLRTMQSFGQKRKDEENEDSKKSEILNKMKEVYEESLSNITDLSKETLLSLEGVNEIFGTIGLGLASTFMNASHDLQAFATGMTQTGSWIGGVINTLVEAIANVCKEMGGFEDALNPVTYLIKELSVLVEFIMHLISDIVKIIGAVAKILNTILKVISPLLKLIEKLADVIANLISGVADRFADVMESIFFWVDANDAEAEAKEEEAERLRQLNAEYSSLYDAMREQEEYYLNKRLEINANAYKDKVRGVNDMILTPKGTFSTHPEDTILAMKHPENLMSRGTISVQINNYSNNEVETSTDDYGNLIVNISRKVAQDYANGSNGWDSAYTERAVSMQGRAYSI